MMRRSSSRRAAMMSYLRGPLTKDQIRILMSGQRSPAVAATAAMPVSSSSQRPALPPTIRQVFLPAHPGVRVLYSRGCWARQPSGLRTSLASSKLAKLFWRDRSRTEWLALSGGTSGVQLSDLEKTPPATRNLRKLRLQQFGQRTIQLGRGILSKPFSQLSVSRFFVVPA